MKGKGGWGDVKLVIFDAPLASQLTIEDRLQMLKHILINLTFCEVFW
jgi:hypothetical protein